MHKLGIKNSFYEKTARGRIEALVDENSFLEILKPDEYALSPHLQALDISGSFDDGVVIGTARINQQPIHIIAQEGQFMGGAVGEIHGAKIVGLLLKAIKDKSHAVIFLVDSGGVRLHEANAGLIAISEVMRAMLAVRNAGIRIVTMIGGTCGAFGGMGISACLSSHIIMTEEGRLALSGPEVIETVKGVEEFDSKDRALVWRVTGGKNRFLLGHIDALVEDHIDDIRQAISRMLIAPLKNLDIETLTEQQKSLKQQYQKWIGYNDGLDIWKDLGIQCAEKIPMLSASKVTEIKKGLNQ